MAGYTRSEQCSDIFIYVWDAAGVSMEPANLENGVVPDDLTTLKPLWNGEGDLERDLEQALRIAPGKRVVVEFCVSVYRGSEGRVGGTAHITSIELLDRKDRVASPSRKQNKHMGSRKWTLYDRVHVQLE